MTKRRFLRGLILLAAILFLLVLAFKFKPRLDTPAPASPPSLPDVGQATLNTEEFRYVQHSGNEVDFVLTADEVRETPDGERLLTEPVVLVPGGDSDEDRATGRKGSLNPATRVVRIWGDARLEASSWTCDSSGFRFTPEGEVVSEGPVKFRRGEMRGSGELLRFHRFHRVLHLQGDVRFEEGDRVMECGRSRVDLAAHNGSLEGGVKAELPEGTVTAPRGILKLTPDNRLQALRLVDSVKGDGPRGSFRSTFLTIDWNAQGRPQTYLLEEQVHVKTVGKEPWTVDTEKLHLVPEGADTWNWDSPGPMLMAGREETARAASGRGTFRGKEAEAELAGPVEGEGALGTFSGASAQLAKGTWTLSGDASASRSGDTILADVIRWREDRSAEAEGNVRGKRAAGDEVKPMEFTSRTASMASGGWPLKLRGDVHVTRESMTITAPRMDIPDRSRLTASGGALAVSKDEDGGEDRMEGETLQYDGEKRLAWAEGDAKGEGRDYTVTANRVEVRLDEQDHPVSYLALGDARFQGTDYEGEGDRLTFDPKTKSGEAYRESSKAVVVQKNPYRRLAAPRVKFSPSRLEAVSEGRTGGRPVLVGTVEEVDPHDS